MIVDIYRIYSCNLKANFARKELRLPTITLITCNISSFTLSEYTQNILEIISMQTYVILSNKK